MTSSDERYEAIVARREEAITNGTHWTPEYNELFVLYHHEAPSIDLRNADLRAENLTYALDSVISGANLNGALLPDDIPVVENIHTKIVNAVEHKRQSFYMQGWHEKRRDENGRFCGTSHCYAGWAIHLAGEAGYALEHQSTPGVAGAFILIKSSPQLNGIVPSFYNWNEAEVLEGIRALAEQEQAAGN